MDVVFQPIPTLPIVKAHLVVNCVLVFFAVAAVGARFWARFTSGVKFWWDDWLVLAAVPQGIGMLIIQGLYSRLGVGYDITETLVNLPLILRLLVAYEFIFATTISTIKISMLMFYLRIFPPQTRLRFVVKCVLVFVLLWTTGNILQVFLICRPFRSTYDPSVPGTCGNQVASFIAIGAFNAITDVLILSLPLKTVWGLKMRTPAKFGITFVFAVGLLVTIVAIIRIVALTKLDLTNLTLTMIDADFWSTFEPNVGILCVCMPTLGPLWSGCSTRIKAATGSGSKVNSSGPSSAYAKGSMGASRFNRLEDGPGVVGASLGNSSTTDSYKLDRIYAANRSDGANFHNSSGKEDGSSLSGSETALSPEHLPASAIQVSTMWTVSSERA